MDLNKLQQILGRAQGKRLLVIGDLMLDEFVWGKVGRISPEAPVPVVEVPRETFYPGGAPHAARNLREFIRDVGVIGVVGRDDYGLRLRQLLHEKGIETGALVQDADFVT